MEYAGDRVEERLALLLPQGVRWAFEVVDLTAGRELMSAGNAAKEPLLPGSLVKLLTTGAVLDRAGTGNLDMKTSLHHDGTIQGTELRGNIYLTGRGNALMSAADLRAMASELSFREIRKISGDLMVDAAFLDPQGLERKLEGAASAKPGALGLDLHTVAVTVSPSTPGRPPKVQVEPANDAVRMAVEARTAATGAATIRITRLDDLSFSITGNIPPGASPVKQRFPLKEPALYAGGTLRTLLKETDISVTGELRMGRTPAAATELGEIPSPDPDTLLRDMNVNSLNVVADNLLLILGGEKLGTPGTREKGVQAEREFLAAIGLPLGGVQIADGSGLSGENRVTAEFMAAYLRKAAQKQWFPQFYATLPRAGMDGTAREIGFRDDRFRVKTGNLPDAFGLAGYGVDGGGRKVAFAFIVNHPGIAAMDMKRAGAEVMRFISTEVFQ